jgi:hypothetical protein
VRAGIRVAGPVPATQVWERYAVPARWPGWAPQIRAVRASAPRIAPGVTGRVHGPLGLRVDFVVTEVDEPGRAWAWRVRIGPLRLQLRHGVEENGVEENGVEENGVEPDPAGSATWLSVDGPAPIVAGYLPVARLALHRLVHRPG